MDFKQLVTFIEVANLKSFSKASDKIYLTQPTVTNHIQKLEEELGVCLFNRNGREVTLTQPGTIFYNYAKEMINLKDCAVHKFDEYKCKINGTIEINTSSIPAQYILPFIIKEFKSLYPDVYFRIIQTDTKKVYDLIEEGYTNFGIVGAKHNLNNVTYTKIIKDNLVLALPASYKNEYNNYDIIELEKILKIPLIIREEGSGSRHQIKGNLEELGISLNELKITSEATDNETIKKMIGLNIGASFISELAIKKEISNGDIIPVKISGMTLERNFYFVCHKKRYLSPLEETFRNFVLNHVNSII